MVGAPQVPFVLYTKRTFTVNKQKHPAPSTHNHALIYKNFDMDDESYTNKKKSECYAFSHFCHIGMPYDVLYLVPIVAKNYCTPCTPKHARIFTFFDFDDELWQNKRE